MTSRQKGRLSFEAAFLCGCRAWLLLLHSGVAGPVMWAGLMAETISQEPLFTAVDLLLPVPLADEKLRARGFNQAALLAEEIGRLLQVPISGRVLLKDYETSAQAGLTRTARESNLSGVFRVANTNAVQGKNIMIIDDVFTTGCTMSTAALALRDAGARHVFGLTAAAGRYF